MVKNLKRSERLKLGLLKPGEVAAITHTLPSTIRYYANLGILRISDYTQGKYRLFKKDDTLAAMARIKAFKEKGLTLVEIKEKLKQ